MKKTLKKGFGFGITSGIITTLGVIIGLYSTTKSSTIIIAGIISVAIADSFSDGFGIHVAEETVGSASRKVWELTGYTFLFELIFALTFIIPFLIFEVGVSVIICIIYSIFLLSLYSYAISIANKRKPLPAIIEHFLLTIVVVIITYFVGDMVRLIVR